MRLLVTGDRNWTDYDRVRRVLESFEPGILIHGAAKGADSIAGEIAEELGWEVEVYPADWSIGRRAGPMRNRQMLQTEPDLVLAFHDDLDHSKGTRNCVHQAVTMGIPVAVCL